MRFAICAVLATLSCSGKAVDPPKAMEDAGGDVIDTPSTCVVQGSAPFAAQFHGELPDRYGPLLIEAWFPQGRLPGKTVAFRWAGEVGFATLDAAGSATVSLPDPCAPGLRLTLGASPGLAVKGTVNGSGRLSDAPRLIDLDVTLCPSGVPAVTTPSASPALRVFPTAVLSIKGVPADQASLAAIHATPEWDLLAVAADGFVVAPKTAFDPFVETTIDLAPARDIMGVPYGLGVATTLSLSAVVTDPAFEAGTLPDGAFIGTAPAIVSGRLLVPATKYVGDYHVMLGLGDAKGAKSVRLRHRLVCEGPTGAATIRLISERGEIVLATPRCKSDPVDELVPLPAGGRWALEASAARNQIGCRADGSYAPAAYELDEFAFE